MSKAHTELMARIGFVGAIVPTYRDKKYPQDAIERRLNAVDQLVAAAIRHFGRVGKDNLASIGDRIDKMNEGSCLGKPRSILTFIDFAVEILEDTLTPSKSIANIKGAQGRVYIRRLIRALVDLRYAISPDRNFEICSLAGIKAAGVWKELAS
jgi:hypothetical protein